MTRITQQYSQTISVEFSLAFYNDFYRLESFFVVTLKHSCKWGGIWDFFLVLHFEN